jgi:hypothetical protein
MYSYDFNDTYTEFNYDKTEFMLFRFNDLDFLDSDKRHADGEGFISSLETHYMNMGYPTHTKKFKELYIKMINDSGHVIPLYVTIKVDDTVVMDPSNYEIVYNEENDTYYYVEKIDNNYELITSRALGEFTLGYDKLGNKTIQQIKIKIRSKGRGIKIILSDGYNDYTNIITSDNGEGIPNRSRNKNDFSISTIGIVYKLKKVKEG